MRSYTGYIADHGSPGVALRYTRAIIEYCEGMRTVPHRGTRRDDIRPGLRITHYKGRAMARALRRGVLPHKPRQHSKMGKSGGAGAIGRPQSRGLERPPTLLVALRWDQVDLKSVWLSSEADGP